MSRPRVPTFEDLDRGLAEALVECSFAVVEHEDDHRLLRISELVGLVRSLLHRLEESVMLKGTRHAGA